MISASFNQKYAMKKNLLFVIADNDFMDFCLVFKNEAVCKKVYSFILQQKDYQEALDSGLIEARIIIPLFNKIQENLTASTELIEIIAQWIGILDKNSKQQYANLLKENNIYEQITSVMQNIKAESKNGVAVAPATVTSRKRKYDEIGDIKKIAKISKNDRSVSKKLISKKHTQIIHRPRFKIMHIPGTASSHYLLIPAFTVNISSEISSFHEYKRQSSKSNIYLCRNCSTNTAIIGYDENGNICAKLMNVKHDCNPISHFPEGYSEIKLINKCGYKVYENYSKTTKRLLVLFDPENQRMCHEFLWNANNKKFVCRNCIKVKANWNNKSRTKICNEGRSNEYLELSNSYHACEKVEYDAQKHQQFYDHVLKPNFEVCQIQKRNREIQALILFNTNNRNKGYVYYYAPYLQCFVCNYCRKEGKHVTAQLCQNSDGEEYVILIKNQHVCEMRHLPKKEVVLPSSQIEFMEDTKTGIPKLFLFENENRIMCHILTKDRNSRTYYCVGCHYTRTMSKGNDKSVFSGYHITDKSGKHSFQLKDSNQKHICKPKKYEPEKYQNFKTFDFFYFRHQKSSKENLNLAVYNPNDKSSCFIFEYVKRENTFVCQKCLRNKRKIQMSIFKDENGKEYVNHIYKKHLCKPVKVSTIVSPQYTIIESREISVTEKANVRINENIDESKIVRKPNFELQPSQNGIPNRRLVINHPSDPNLYYQYYYQIDGKNFRCYKCTLQKWYIQAKLHTGANNEQYVVLGEKEHKCEPLKRQVSQIYELPDYVIYNKDDDTKPTKIYTFTSSTREFCYAFTCIKIKTNKFFRCSACYRLKKKVHANINTNEHGDECVQVTEEHICEPMKFEPEQHQVRTMPESMFLLCPNANGVEDRTLLIFSTEKKELVHSYSWNHGSFFCVKCDNKKVKVTAKIRTNENGEKYAELIGPEHVCTAKPFNPKKIRDKDFKPEIIPESMFLLTENRNGEKNKKLIVFASDEHDMAYIFRHNYENHFQCSKCQAMKKYDVTALLKIDENGSKYMEMKNGQHICKPQKFVPNSIEAEKTIVPATLFELRKNKNGKENGKLLIFTSETKKLGYNYCKMKGSTYYCSMCKGMKRYGVNAKICENGEKFAEITSVSHACKPRSYQSLIK